MTERNELPTGTVTFLLTDVEGSTAMFERSADGARRALQRHHEILSGTVRDHGGECPLEQGEGDSVVAVFPRAPDAVACAVAAQRQLRGEAWPDGIDLRVRMSVHTGEAVLRDAGRYTGLSIHRAARVRGLAHGGQVLVTSTAAELAADELPVDAHLVDLGRHRLRDLSRSERIFQLTLGDDTEPFPPLRSLDAIANNLPSQTSSFVGRERELAELAALIGGERLVTLVGAGGVGKTRLAIQAAANADHDVDAVWLVELARIPSGTEISAFVNAAIGRREQPGREPFAVLAEHLVTTRALLVLDNCEHVVDAAARFVVDLLAAAPSIVVVTTSREPLGVPGEATYRVPPLDLHAEGRARDCDATQLFIDRARLARPTFRPSDDELSTILDICTRLDGLPLAIELAAARTRVMSPFKIADGLADRFRLLTGGGRTVMARQQTLRASIDWSYGLLSDQEQLVLQRLAVFAGGFTLEAVEPIVVGTTIDPYDVLDLFSQLVDKSLVQVEPGSDDVRYRLLESIRDYALERLADRNDFEDVRDRHLDFYEQMCAAARSGLEGSDLPRWVDRLARERANLNAAFEWADERGRADTRWSMCGSMTFFWMSTGQFSEARRWFDVCLRTPATDPGDELAARCGAAHLAFYAGEFEQGIDLATVALEASRRCGDQRSAARAMSSLATIDIYSDPAAASEALREAASIAESCGDMWCQCDAIQIAGYCQALLDHHATALDDLDVALPLARRLDNPQLLAWDLLGRGWVHCRRAQFGEARRCFDAGRHHAERTGDPNIVGTAAALRTPLEIAEGNAEAWLPVVRDALARSVQQGAGTAVPGLALALLTTAVTVGSTGEADVLIADYAHLVTALLPALGSRFMNAAARAALTAGEPAVARERSQRAHALATEVGNLVEAAIACTMTAVIDLVDGHATRAHEQLHEALPVLVDAGCPTDLTDCIAAFAASAALRQMPGESVRLWAAVDSAAHRSGIGYLPSASLLQELRTLAYDESDPAQIEPLTQEGAAMPLDEVATFLLRSRGERNRPKFGWDSLTPTENQVVGLVAQGLSNAAVGERMFISAGTVKTHLAHIYAKLELSNRTEVTAAFAKRGT